MVVLGGGLFLMSEVPTYRTWNDVGCRVLSVKHLRGGLVFKAGRLVYHSTPSSRVIKKKKKKDGPRQEHVAAGRSYASVTSWSNNTELGWSNNKELGWSNNTELGWSNNKEVCDMSFEPRQATTR